MRVIVRIILPQTINPSSEFSFVLVALAIHTVSFEVYSSLTSHSIYEMLSRLSAKAISRRAHKSVRTFASVEKTSSGPLGDDGRHEIWRGDVDHDNEPKVRIIFGSLYDRVLMLFSSSQIGFVLDTEITIYTSTMH